VNRDNSAFAILNGRHHPQVVCADRVFQSNESAAMLGSES
jgi:hypothetical protein